MANLTPRTRSESFLNGEDLEPITRREHFYAGRENELPEGHREPETREEWFIKKYREAGDVTVESLSIAENGTYTAPSGKAYSPVSVNVPLPSNAYLLQTIEHESIATFTDGTDNFVKSLEISIEPQQDLHGYDAPWGGGSGKNKFDSDTVLSAFTKNNNKYVGIPSYVDDNYVINGGFKTNTRYTLSYKAYNNTSVSSNFRFIFSYTDETEEVIGGFVDTTTEKVIVGTSAENKTISKIRRAYGNGAEITLYDIQLEEGSTATSFAPYSNICPINGHTEANVSVCGVNIWDEEWEVGSISNTTGQNTINNSTIRTKNYIPVVPNTQYYINSSKWQFVAGYDADKKFVGTVSYASSGTGYYINVPSNVYYIRIPFSTAYGTTYNNDISINYPSTDTEYHIYNGQTYTISLNGTRYGGKLDVVNGVLTITDGFISSYNGETLPSTWISDRDLYAEGTTPTTGAEVCYKLATPQTIQLTPTHIKSLQGENNFFASTGDVERLQYWGKEVS